MKRILLLTIALVMLTALTPIMQTHANYTAPKTVVLHKHPIPDPEQPEDQKGRRSVQKPIFCVISCDGISIQGIDTSEIFLYEVCAPDGETIASFVSEIDFAHYLMNEDSEVEIQLHVEDYILSGYL